MSVSPESGPIFRDTGIDIYQHDSAAVFQFVLRGELAGDSVREVQHAWNTARSILNGKELVIDISGIAHADGEGVELLSRMRESGARLTPALPPESGDGLCFPATPAAVAGRHASVTRFGKAVAVYRSLARIIFHRADPVSR